MSINTTLKLALDLAAKVTCKEELTELEGTGAGCRPRLYSVPPGQSNLRVAGVGLGDSSLLCCMDDEDINKAMRKWMGSRSYRCSRRLSMVNGFDDAERGRMAFSNQCQSSGGLPSLNFW